MEPEHPLSPTADGGGANDELDLGFTLDDRPSRKVTFPNDERIVSGYMDPPDPWGKSYCCTTEELVCAYRAACDANCVQPHRHLLDQLQGIDLSVCNDRYEMLSCRNLRLDSRHVEALEEIFKRVQFKTLDFENCALEEDSAIALFDMIEYYESCCKLNIAHNTRIGLRGWQMCSRMLKKTPCLHTLDLHGIQLAEQSIPALVRSLRIGSPLVTLHLEHSNITGRNLLILVTALRINDSLRELLLADNKLTPNDGQHLASLLRNTPTLQMLDLRNNALQDTGCAHVCEGLYEQQGGECGLTALVLWHNQISHEAMPAVSAALAVNRHLQTLNLGHNLLGSEGAHLLREGLLRNRCLLRLGLQWCRVGCEGAVALAECLAECPQLLRLDLRDNQIRTAGLMALKLALSVNQSLTRLDLDKDLKKEPNMKDYAEQQSALLEAITGLLQRNRARARDRELRQLDEQQRLLERDETSSQDSLHRPRCQQATAAPLGGERPMEEATLRLEGDEGKATPPAATEAEAHAASDTTATTASPTDEPQSGTTLRPSDLLGPMSGSCPPADEAAAAAAAADAAAAFACVTSPTDRALEDIVAGFAGGSGGDFNDSGVDDDEDNGSGEGQHYLGSGGGGPVLLPPVTLAPVALVPSAASAVPHADLSGSLSPAAPENELAAMGVQSAENDFLSDQSRPTDDSLTDQPRPTEELTDQPRPTELTDQSRPTEELTDQSRPTEELTDQSRPTEESTDQSRPTEKSPNQPQDELKHHAPEAWPEASLANRPQDE